MARIDNLSNFIQDVGQAIKEKKGIPQEQKIQVRNFDTEIASIETGGGGGTPSETPFEEVYNATRPSDWLQFPSDEDVLDNEVYMLINIPNTDETLFTFRSVFTGEAFIDTGDGNVFPLTSNVKFEYAYDFNQVSGVVNSEGNKQVIAKVYGGVFTTIDFYQPHSRKSSGYQQPILDIKMRASLCSSLLVSSSSATRQVNRKLKYFNFLGVNNVTNMNGAFQNCYSLTSLNIDTSSVTRMESTFQYCYSLTALNIDTSNVTSMSNTFYGCYSLTALNIDTSSVTRMEQTFYGCYSLTTLNIDTSNVTSMSGAFYNCYSLTSLNIDTSSVTNMQNTFQYCYSLTALNIDTSNVTSMYNTFQNCYSLTSLNIDTSSVTSMNSTFYGCYSLTTLNIDTSNVTNMSGAFYNCYSLTSLNIDTSSVTNMQNTFYGCYSLTALNIDTSNVTSMSYTFYGCYSLTSLSQLDVSKVTNSSSTFNYNYSLADFSILSSLGNPTKVLTFYLQNTNLSRNKLVEFATNLPVTTVDKTININGTLGTQDLTEDDKAIFTDKGYILVV